MSLSHKAAKTIREREDVLSYVARQDFAAKLFNFLVEGSRLRPTGTEVKVEAGTVDPAHHVHQPGFHTPGIQRAENMQNTNCLLAHSALPTPTSVREKCRSFPTPQIR
jgi:hypothetical protein